MAAPLPQNVLQSTLRGVGTPPRENGGQNVPRETARLLDAWREAERAAGAARMAAEHAQEAADAAASAADAAAKAAEAARIAAEDAGLSLEEADRVAGGAKKAYHDRETELLEQEEERRPKGVPGGLGETT